MAELISSEKIQALKTIAQARRKTDLKKTIRQRGAVGLADDGNVVKGTFHATSKETPPHEEWFFYIALEEDPKNFRATEEKLQDKIR